MSNRELGPRRDVSNMATEHALMMDVGAQIRCLSRININRADVGPVFIPTECRLLESKDVLPTTFDTVHGSCQYLALSSKCDYVDG